MARAERRATEDCDKWFGWGQVENYSSMVESDHCQSESRHKWEIENKTNKTITLNAEYSHVLQRRLKLPNQNWQDVAEDKVDGPFSVEPFQSYGYQHWGKEINRSTFEDYDDQFDYRLKCYTAVRGAGGDLEGYKFVPTTV